MNIHTNKQNRDVRTAKVEQDVALRVIAKRVAKKLGVSLDSPTVSYRAYITSRSISTGFTYEVEVEIIDDHAATVTAA
jgi:PhoPQ-activated pathogenicity-related protein